MILFNIIYLSVLLHTRKKRVTNSKIGNNYINDYYFLIIIINAHEK
jgi:hypothetical protein